MTLTRITLTVVLVLAGASLAFAGGGRHHYKPSSHEVCTVDQSNSAGKTKGGTLYVYDPQRLEEPEKIDLGGEAEALCVGATTTAPVRPHMVLIVSVDELQHTDSHGAALTRFGRYLWVADRMGNRIVVIDTWTDELANEIPLVGPLSTDPSPDLMDTSPRGDKVYVSLRGSIPLSDDPHASTGNTPGLCVIKVSKSGRSGRIESIQRIANVDPAGIDRADPHALRVRDLSPRWGG